ncbi:MAG: pitrilysin family protein [Pseudomonadota bacterium]|nr:pitrilysin family protein [Pseudomonadota bacterium]
MRPLLRFFVLIWLLGTGPAHSDNPVLDIQIITTPSGVTAWLMSDSTVPVITMRFAFPGGAALDPVGKEGLARLLAATMDEGAGDLDSQAFQGALEDKSIQISFSANKDMLTGRLVTLSRNRDTAFDLLHLAITDPRFDPEPVERMKNALMASRRSSLGHPDTLAGWHLNSAVYADHPYAMPILGGRCSLSGLTANDLQAAHGRLVTRDGLLVTVAGDIGADELAAKLEAVFSRSPKTGRAAIPPVPAHPNETILVPFAGPQSTIRFAQEGVKPDNPDFITSLVLNHILGGGMKSRLMKGLRAGDGSTYGAWTVPIRRHDAALWLGGVATANDKVADILERLRTIWRQVAEGGVTEDEVALSRSVLTGGFFLRMATTGGIADLMLGYRLDGFSPSDLNAFPARMASVTAADVSDVARRCLDPAMLTTVIVGTPEGVEADRQTEIDPF